MLTQVSETLQYFQAGVLKVCRNPPKVTIDPAHFKFPTMKKLASLCLPTVNQFDLGFTNLTQVDLPSLKRVDLKLEEGDYQFSGCLTNFLMNLSPKFPLSSVEELRLEVVDIDCPTSDLISFKIWQTFPNLERLTVKICEPKERDDKMKEFFKNLRQCVDTLSYLTILICTKCSFSELMDGMGCGRKGDEDGYHFPKGSLKHIQVVR
ncbi:uncharacterized protein LOC118433497 [Folsomia candida]|uniref:uncharacterized protein LOC118433497 n=1 Tax=Folsomia candida TaxID=158441 RepID=UPI001604C538|nr:uncharacterized protein LOC118433497 [Folsomia candida]